MADDGPTVVAAEALNELFPHSDGLTRVCASADGRRVVSYPIATLTPTAERTRAAAMG